MSVKEITSLEEFNKIISGDQVSFFDFWATWCGPCRVISPVFESLSDAAAKIGADVAFYKVDVDVAAAIAQEVGIRAMPTFIAFRAGERLGDLVGANPTALKNLIEAHSVEGQVKGTSEEL